jgi:prophage maintenance system killer protein
MKDSEIEIYQSEDGIAEVQVKFEKETVWLSQKQMAHLFDKDTDTIGLHLRNVYKSGELEPESTTEESSVVQKEGNRKVKRKLNLYNLDAIISVGIKGYAINEQRLAQKNEQLKELQKTVKILDKALNYKTLSNDESIGLLKIITDYSYALDILDQYDYQKLEINNTSEKELFHLTYENAIKQIQIVKETYGNSDLFGHEKDDSFKSSIATIYQTFEGVELYPSIEEKGANLLYFITKNHSFTDGNKRIAAFLFLFFLEKNGILFNEFGNKRIADNTLVALTLMIAYYTPAVASTAY